MADKQDLSRWNRAGLSRFKYIDGNAVSYLEDIRLRLEVQFPQWRQVAVQIEPDETQAQKLQRLELQYQLDSDDMLWNISRSFSRAAHALTTTIDAYANESKISTATQWDNVRKMVAMLDYHPAPGASAQSLLVITAKSASLGVLEQGYQVEYTPVDGSAPVVFESLQALNVDAALNAIHPRDYDRNMDHLHGSELCLEEPVDILKIGEPLVLEDQRSSMIKAYLIKGIKVVGQYSCVSVQPKLASNFCSGYTLVHLSPSERLTPVGPVALGAQIAKSLQLSSLTDLTAGEVVVIATVGKKPYYRRLKALNGVKLSFYRSLGELSLSNATVSRPVSMAVSYQGERNTVGGSVIQTLYVAGDWRYLINQWVCDKRSHQGSVYLPIYQVIHCHYRPLGTAVSVGEDAQDKVEQFADIILTTLEPGGPLREGYTALTLGWHTQTDGVMGSIDFSLKNPQSLLVPANMPGTWSCAQYLQKSSRGHYSNSLTSTAPKKASAGDLAVLTQGSQVVWCRLNSVSVDLDTQTAQLEAQESWQDRGGGVFYLSQSKIYTAFKKTLRLKDWQRNNTTISGADIPVNEVPETLVKGREVVVQYAPDKYYSTSIKKIGRDAIELNEDLPQPLETGEWVLADVVLYANVVKIGHGVTRSPKILGSGDASLNNQSFMFEVEDLSFEADADLSHGVRASIQVQVEGREWQQVSSLNNSLATDSHFTLRMTEDRFVKISFGDAQQGRRLPSGVNNVRIGYRQGMGPSGNVSAASLVKGVRPHRLIEALQQPLPASGGAQMQAIESLQRDAPAALLTLERCVSLTDFAQLTIAHPSYQQAQAFALPTGLGQREKIEIVVVPTNGAQLTTELTVGLIDYLTAHSLPGVAIVVSAYQAVLVSFAISLRIDTQSYDSDLVSAEVISALQSAFSIQNRKLGQALYRGEVYQLVEAIAGVENSSCEIKLALLGQPLIEVPRIVKSDNDLIRVIFPNKRQCIHLDDRLPIIDVTVEEYQV